MFLRSAIGSGNFIYAAQVPKILNRIGKGAEIKIPRFYRRHQVVANTYRLAHHFQVAEDLQRAFVEPEVFNGMFDRPIFYKKNTVPR